MKPDCRRVLSQIASYSVEELSLEDADAFTRHLDDCPPCKGHWVLFEKTLTTLSQVDESAISVHQSQQMWLTCLEHAKKKGHSALEASAHASAHAHEFTAESDHESAPEFALKVEVLPQPFRSDSPQREGDRRSSHFLRLSSADSLASPENQTQGSAGAPRTAKSHRLKRLFEAFTPAWSLAFAGGAAAVLVGALLASPTPVDLKPVSQPVAKPVSQLPSMVAFSAPFTAPFARLVGFQKPPHATTGLVDYHAAMAFEPFSDHVAATLISTADQEPKPQLERRTQR